MCGSLMGETGESRYRKMYIGGIYFSLYVLYHRLGGGGGGILSLLSRIHRRSCFFFSLTVDHSSVYCDRSRNFRVFTFRGSEDITAGRDRRLRLWSRINHLDRLEHSVQGCRLVESTLVG